MKELGLICRVRMKKYRSYKGEKGTTADNELNREFRAEKPNQKWVTDITEFRLFGQKLYLSPILDLYSGDIVTYTLSDSPNLLMVTTMLEQAFATIPDNSNLLLHSDQGWHYRHKQYVRMLKEKGVQQSMSRKGNCYDNSVMENFFGHLKSELLYLQEFESIQALMPLMKGSNPLTSSSGCWGKKSNYLNCIGRDRHCWSLPFIVQGLQIPSTRSRNEAEEMLLP